MELLSPAGDIKKLQYALAYGASAVYAAGKEFGLRARSGNFSNAELEKACKLAHQQGKKLYIAVNIYAHNSDLVGLPAYLEFLSSIGVDALIISDPAVFSFAKKYAPNIPVHISTQANVTSWGSVQFWRDAGAKRIILARELSLAEIAEIRSKVSDIELEMFVHGAMCMSYSGRCLLSAYLNGRSANQGDCSQPCRWEYDVIERSRPGETFHLEEDSRGTYVFNSRDLNLISRLDEILEAGIDSLKVEGRMKSLYYVSNVTRTWREAIDLSESKQIIPQQLKDELNKVSHRVYCEGFIDGLDSMNKQYYDSSAYIREWQYLGEMLKTSSNAVTVNVKAKFSVGEEIELIFPDRSKDLKIRVDKIFNSDNEQISFTKPNTEITLAIAGNFPDFGILRKKIL